MKLSSSDLSEILDALVRMVGFENAKAKSTTVLRKVISPLFFKENQKLLFRSLLINYSTITKNGINYINFWPVSNGGCTQECPSVRLPKCASVNILPFAKRKISPTHF